jgi:hypothetical protein
LQAVLDAVTPLLPTDATTTPSVDGPFPEDPMFADSSNVHFVVMHEFVLALAGEAPLSRVVCDEAVAGTLLQRQRAGQILLMLTSVPSTPSDTFTVDLSLGGEVATFDASIEDRSDGPRGMCLKHLTVRSGTSAGLRSIQF